MAINPYQLVQSQLGLAEELLGAEQKKRTSQIETGAQMSKMQSEFEDQIRIAQEKAEAELRKKKKKNPFTSIAKVASMFAGPIAGPILSGLLSMKEMKGQSKHAQRQGQLAKAKALGVDTSRFGKTFLGKSAKDYESSTKTAYDDMIRQAGVSSGDLLMQGLQSGITSMAMSKIGEGIKGKIGDIKAAKGLEEAVGGEEALKELVKTTEIPSDIGVKFQGAEGLKGLAPIDASGAFKVPTDKMGERILFDPKMKVLDKSAKLGFEGASNLGIQQTPSNLIGKMGGSNVDFSRLADKLNPEQLKLLESLGGAEGVSKLADQGFLKSIFEQMQKPTPFGLEEGQTNFLQQLLMMLSNR